MFGRQRRLVVFIIVILAIEGQANQRLLFFFAHFDIVIAIFIVVVVTDIVAIVAPVAFLFHHDVVSDSTSVVALSLFRDGYVSRLQLQLIAVRRIEFFVVKFDPIV